LLGACERLEDGERRRGGEGDEVIFGESKDGVVQALLLERVDDWALPVCQRLKVAPDGDAVFDPRPGDGVRGGEATGGVPTLWDRDKGVDEITRGIPEREALS
jgi:hypothetical protein